MSCCSSYHFCGLPPIDFIGSHDTYDKLKFLIFEEIHVLGECNCLVMTRDVLTFSLVTSDSFPAKSADVCCFGRHIVNCVSVV